MRDGQDRSVVPVRPMMLILSLALTYTFDIEKNKLQFDSTALRAAVELDPTSNRPVVQQLDHQISVTLSEHQLSILVETLDIDPHSFQFCRLLHDPLKKHGKTDPGVGVWVKISVNTGDDQCDEIVLHVKRANR